MCRNLLKNKKSLEVGSTISFAKTSTMSRFASVLTVKTTTQPASCFQAGPLASFDQTHVPVDLGYLSSWQ